MKRNRDPAPPAGLYFDESLLVGGVSQWEMVGGARLREMGVFLTALGASGGGPGCFLRLLVGQGVRFWSFSGVFYGRTKKKGTLSRF